MILSCMAFLFTRHYKVMCDFCYPPSYLRNMEEENIAVSLCVIIIASAILRIKRDRRPHSFSQFLNSLGNLDSRGHPLLGTIQ